MFKKILVPLDGSADSERVLEWVKPFARRGAELHIATVVDTRWSERRGGADAARAAHRLAGRYIDDLVDRTRSEFPSTDGSVGEGRPADEVLRIASRTGAGLIAMETNRSSALLRGVLGSCTDAVVRSGRYPVLVLPPGVEETDPPERPETIVVPLDGSILAESAIPTAVELARSFDAGILLLRGVSPAFFTPGAYGDEGPDPWHAMMELAEEEARNYLDARAGSLRSEGLPVEARTAVGREAGVIFDALDAAQAPLTVMVSHGYGGFVRLMLGSVTSKVIRQGKAPVLVLPAAARQQADRPRDTAGAVSDLMSSPAITTHRDTSLAEASLLMVEHNIGALPVVNDDGCYAGLITESLFLPIEHHVPFSRDAIYRVFDRAVGGAEGLRDALESLRDRPVHQIMMLDRPTVTEDTDLAAAVSLMMRSVVTHLPVVRGGRVVGVLSLHDLLRMLAGKA